MRLAEHFDTFLTETVNLNQTRIDTLEQRVGTIQQFLTNSGYAPQIRRYSRQGSWAHKTIIRPATEGKEFDADLVVYVSPVLNWRASAYLLSLRRIFQDSDRYTDKISMKSRCVTLNYAGDFHLDIVPVVERYQFFGTTFDVCNQSEDEFEPTDGDGFRDWWNTKTRHLPDGYLVKVVRLLKFLRDAKRTFAVKSVLLTTLVGEQISDVDSLFGATYFPDIPTSLKTLVGRLDTWLQARETMPRVENPALAGESFTRNWTDEQYVNFREKLHQYREWIDSAYEDPDRDGSIRKWQRLLGGDFARNEATEKATSGLARIAERVQAGADLVTLVLTRGHNALNLVPSTLPHVQAPPFRNDLQQVPVRVAGFEKRTKDGPQLRQYNSGDTIDPRSGVEFHATQANGLPFSTEFKVEWQVVNTGRAAADDRKLRGGFYESERHGVRYEPTLYRGVHWVQAFVVRRRSGTMVGVSERFFVVIP